MNILPKKSWHVRTKENIERVRRDEENAANEEKERQRRAALAESEARTEFLRTQSRHRLEDGPAGETSSALVPVSVPNKHVNFFEDLEQGKHQTGGNAEYEKEKKEEKEKQEKAIGLLTYLGQSAVEAQTEKPWYFKPPAKEEIPETYTGREKAIEEFDTKKKSLHDPMHMMMKYVETTRKRDMGDKYTKPFVGPTRLPQRRDTAAAAQTTTTEQTSGKRKRRDSSSSSSTDSSSSSSSSSDEEERRKKRRKSKKHSKHKSKKHKKKKKKRRKSKSEHSELVVSAPTKTIAQLRAERLRREQEERKRINKLLAKERGEKEEEEVKKPTDDRDRRYNSQFNPDLVRKPKKKRQDYRDMV